MLQRSLVPMMMHLSSSVMDLILVLLNTYEQAHPQRTDLLHWHIFVFKAADLCFLTFLRSQLRLN